MKNEHIWIKKNIMGGTPCVIGTRIPVSNIIQLIEVGKLTPEIIASQYYSHVDVNTIKGAINWYYSKYNGSMAL